MRRNSSNTRRRLAARCSRHRLGPVDRPHRDGRGRRGRGDRAASSSSGSAKPRTLHLAERLADERAQLPREHLGLPRLRVDRARSRRSSRRRRPPGRRRRRPGSSSGACRGTRRACRRTRPRCRPRSCFSRHAWLKNVTLRSDVPSCTTASTSARPLARAPAVDRAHLAEDRRLLADLERRRSRRASCGRSSGAGSAAAGRARCAAHVGEPLLERVADALQARRARSRAGPRSVSGGSPVGTAVLRLLDADEVRVQRLAAVVELDLDVRELHLDVLADALRSRRRARRCRRAR